MNEELRLKDLKEYNILDTLPEKDLNDIIEIASAICDTPVALISFVDENRQWFKAKKGLDFNETPRTISFCQHTLNNPTEVLVVDNPLHDIRFANNPLVKGNPSVRFYAGAPLESSKGFVLGTICVLDFKERTITESQKRALKLLANKVMDILESKRIVTFQNEEIEQNLSRLRLLTDHAPGVIYQLEMSPSGKMSFSFISEGIRIVHPYLDIEELKEKPEIAFEVVHPDEKQQVQDSLFASFKNMVEWNIEYRVISDTGKISWHWANAKPERKPDGTVVLYGTFQDITHQKAYIQTLEQIIFDISHVMRKPVATILGLADIIDVNAMDKKTLTEMVEHIKFTSREMDNYLHKLNTAYTDKRLNYFNINKED